MRGGLGDLEEGRVLGKLILHPVSWSPNLQVHKFRPGRRRSLPRSSVFHPLSGAQASKPSERKAVHPSLSAAKLNPVLSEAKNQT